jgi:hypothetical protein
MVQWYNGTMVQWYNGTMVQWCRGVEVGHGDRLAVCGWRHARIQDLVSITPGLYPGPSPVGEGCGMRQSVEDRA